ncbi:MAG: histidine ammonia-lyase [Candidatus Delongbacteria bacterium]|nr:histidine ammonia-lyase [Candidatus Delongbacteria bacterium]MCG2760296.1 histidine ammonia-lyase [Candidatus Delongbacteria bacterium]
MKTLELNGKNLNLDNLKKIVYGGYTVSITKDSENKIKRCRKIVEEIIENETVKYGINTGFGKFSSVVINKENTVRLQKNIILSHAVGVGKPLPEDIVKGVMLLKLNSFLKGYSGVRYKVALTLIKMINNGVIPYIPEKGSVGASGDLAPLSHMALVMTGKGKAFYKGKLISGKKAMELADIAVLVLQQKEGLAILNGTQVMTSIAAVCLLKANTLIKTADITGAMTLEALRGTLSAFDKRIQDARPHPGQIDTAENIRRLLKDSDIIKSHIKCSKVQDAYSLRCIPQVHGAVKDTFNHVKRTVEIEMNSVTDNPLVFENDHDIISGGNFHGEPIAFVMDFMGIAISELASISERRIEYMLDAATNDELPAFLINNGGINSGHMMTQVTAAALVSENKVLAHPASVDSIPTSSNKEDHVSMGTHAARKLLEILDNVGNVISIELLCAAQALDFRDPEKASKATGSVYKLIRSKVKFMKNDRFIHPDIVTLNNFVTSGAVLEAAENISGKLTI